MHNDAKVASDLLELCKLTETVQAKNTSAKPLEAIVNVC